MKAIDRRRSWPWVALVVSWVLFGCTSSAVAQLPATEEERLQILTEPDALKKKIEKEKNRAPFEFFRSRVAPFDILPYVRANHWASLMFELRANDDDYDGYLKTDPVSLLGRPQQVVYSREARLLKEKRANLTMQVMIPAANGLVPKELMVDMVRQNALRPDANWQAALSTLPPHQMLVLDPEQGRDDQVRRVESDVGDHSDVGRTRRGRSRKVAVLPARSAPRARQAGAFIAPSDLDND